MKERPVDLERAVIAHNQAPVIPQPANGALHDPAAAIAPQGAAILRRRTNAILFVRADQFAAALPQPLAQRVAVISLVGNHPHRLLPRSARMVTPPYADGRERRLREPDFRRGGRVKWSPKGRPWPSTTTSHFVPLPRLVFPTPQPLFSPVQNCRPETTRSTATAGARSTRSGTRARCSTTRPARPSPAVAASKSKGADISLASPASERRCAESTESLRGRDGCRSTGGHLALLGWPGEQGRDLLPLRFGQQRTGPRHPPSFGAADSAYRISQNSTIVISDACTRLCNSF